MLREEAIEKIRKLLALADGNANENEALSAALKAQKLIAEYDVEDHEIAGEEVGREPVTVESEPFVRADWRSWLAAAVADNFRCKFYRNGKRNGPRSVEWTVRFIGYDLDARAALLTYEKLAEVGERLCKEACAAARRAHGTSQGVRASYLNGYCEGVRRELEKQCHALMLVCPSAVAEKFGELNLKEHKRTYRVTIDASDDGRAAGRDAVRSGRLGDAAAPQLATA